MSDEQFDELTNRTRAVFDDYQDNTADEGWLKLREEYPERKKDRMAAWLWPAAGLVALLLIFLSISLWFNFHPGNKGRRVVKNTGIKNAPGITKASPAAALAADAQLNITKQGQVAGKKVNPIVGSSAIGTLPAPQISASTKLINKTIHTIHNQATQPDSIAVNNVIAYQLPGKTKPPVAALVNPQPVSPVTATDKPVVKDQSLVIAKQPDRSIQSMFDNDKSTQNSSKLQIKDKRVAFAVYAATYVNYARGSNKQFNTGGGISSDIRLTDNLSLSTGIAIAQNSLAYNSPVAAQSTQFAATALHVQKSGFSATLSEVSPTSTNLNASLINLDVPVNLKYVFDPQKKNIYLSAGLSSGTFINETYKYSYNYPNGSAAEPSADEGSHKAFSNFYFGSMLNVSFGVGYPVGKTQLIFEPFFKYPINGLGDQHISFGSGGLNLKINIDPPKK